MKARLNLKLSPRTQRLGPHKNSLCCSVLFVYFYTKHFITNAKEFLREIISTIFNSNICSQIRAKISVGRKLSNQGLQKYSACQHFEANSSVFRAFWTVAALLTG